MNNSTGEIVQRAIESLLTFTFILTPFILYFKRRKQRKKFSNPKQLEAIDFKALNTAEEKVKNLDINKYLFENFILIKTFQTFKGHDDSTMTDLVIKMKEQGFNCEYRFIQSLPAGVASLTTATGVYQFFVEKERAETGKETLSKILNN